MFVLGVVVRDVDVVRAECWGAAMTAACVDVDLRYEIAAAAVVEDGAIVCCGCESWSCRCSGSGCAWRRNG